MHWKAHPGLSLYAPLYRTHIVCACMSIVYNGRPCSEVLILTQWTVSCRKGSPSKHWGLDSPSLIITHICYELSEPYFTRRKVDTRNCIDSEKNVRKIWVNISTETITNNWFMYFNIIDLYYLLFILGTIYELSTKISSIDSAITFAVFYMSIYNNIIFISIINIIS